MESILLCCVIFQLYKVPVGEGQISKSCILSYNIWIESSIRLGLLNQLRRDLIQKETQSHSFRNQAQQNWLGPHFSVEQGLLPQNLIVLYSSKYNITLSLLPLNYIMFELKNHTNNLQYSQRFYYSNYEFYNDYDDPKQYAHDISKIFYSCRRKTVPIIVRYCPTEMEIEQDRVVRSNIQNQEEEMTMEQFLDSFINAFEQNNYSDFPDNALEDCKNIFKISNYPKDFLLKLKYNPKQKELKALKQPNNDLILRTLKGILENIVRDILASDNNQLIHAHEIEYFRYLLAYSELASHLLYNELFWKKNNKIFENFLLFEKLIEQKLEDINIGQTSSVQVLYIPKLQTLSYFINPALLVVKNYLRKSEEYSRSESNSQQAFNRQIPKIAFINLDSRQYPLNFQFFKTNTSTNMIYISIYKQIQDLNETNDESTTFYSRYLSQLVYECNNSHNKTPLSSPILFAFPLSSHYVKSKVEQNKWKQKKPHLTGTSADITFLFQNCIYEELRIFVPNVIFISYNGSLNIEQSYFNQILRTLTLIADHKVILFTNFCTLFYQHNYLSQELNRMLQTIKNNDKCFDSHTRSDSNQMIQSQEHFIEKSYDYSKIQSQQQNMLAITKFIQDYLHLEINHIDINQFFNNLGMFNKITSGAYSFQRKREIKPSEKFEIGQKYLYLETLSELKEFQYLRKYCSSGKSAKTFATLMNMQRDNLLKINKEESNFFKYFIDKGIKILTEKTEQLPKKLKYKLQKLKLHYETHEDEGGFERYLEQKKKSILIETITKQKIKKIFSLNSSKKSQKEAQLRDIRSFDLYLRNSQGQKQQIFLDGFSQVMMDATCSVLFCINYLHYQFKLCTLYGFPEQDKQEVQMFILKEQNFQKCNLYFEYSYYFGPQNNLLYLYWPYEWDAVEQACSLLLSVKYEPKLINYIQVIRYNSCTKQPLTPACMMHFKVEKKNNIEMVPRYGTTMWAKSEEQLFIFGGFYDNKNDFNVRSSGVSIVKLQSDSYFTVQDISKAHLGIILRPKANYVITRLNEDNIVIQGGYGREFTNFYNVYSYVRYIFNLQTYKMKTEKTKRHISSLQSPITNKRLGQYEAVKFQNGVPKPEILTDMKKHRFILRDEQTDKLISFITNQYNVSTHKQDTKSSAVFELNRRIKNIYCHTHCSPQLYLQKKEEKNIIRIEILATIYNEKEQFAKTHLLPYEDSLISTCISDCGQSIYILAESPVFTNQAYIIYEGNLGDIDQILQKKEIKLKKYYEFNVNAKNISYKTLHSVNNMLIVTGGVPSENGYRQDYVIEYFRGILRPKSIRISHEQSEVLTMKNSYVISQPDDKQSCYLYCIQADPETQTIYQLKIQVLCIKSCGSEHPIYISNLTTCTIINNRVFEIKPDFSNPVIVSIQKYYMFNLDTLYEKLRSFVNAVNIFLDNSSSNYAQEVKAELNTILPFLDMNQEQLIGELDKLYQNMSAFHKFISSQNRKNEQPSEMENSISHILSALLTFRVENICLKFVADPELKQLYRFYLQDRKYPEAKYIALGELGSSSLVFFRLKFNKKVAIPIKMTDNSFLYGRNLVADNAINQILFSDENFIKKYISEDQDSMDITEIEPFEAQVHECSVHCQIEAILQEQMN